MRSPSSRASLKLHLSAVDSIIAAAAPIGALYCRSVHLVSSADWATAGVYCLVSVVCSLVAFQTFSISDTIPRFISSRDLLRVAKAVAAGQLVSALLLFTATRLDGIPRSVPAIQALLLGGGLLVYRISINLLEARYRQADGRAQDAARENVILIGLNDWSVLVMKFLKSRAPERWRIIALLDSETRWVGRLVNGVRVFGSPAQLEAAIEEFATHGVVTDRVVVGGTAGDLSDQDLAEAQRVCARRDLDLVFLPELFDCDQAGRNRQMTGRYSHCQAGLRSPPQLPLSPYFYCKRILDALFAGILMIGLLLPLTLAAIVVLLDVGSPIFFWQQRMGRNGRDLHVFKLRTLRPPYDRKGRKLTDEERLSRTGRLLRRIRIDELPQLMNVLAGDMSLIGPRPLLPQDQPPDSALRLSVRPGITGWAQVNGGSKLSAREKQVLDGWYIRNASLLLDLRIIGLTLLSLLWGDRRSEKALAQAEGDEMMQTVRDAKQTVSRFPTAISGVGRADVRESAVTQSR